MSLERLTGLPENSVSYIMNFLCTVGFLEKFDIGNVKIYDGIIKSINFWERGILICEGEDKSNLVYEIVGIPPEEFQKIRDKLIEYCMGKTKP